MPLTKAVTSTPSSAPSQSFKLLLLIALIISSTLGGGIFALPQNMAASAGAGAVLCSWIIAGLGMLMLAFVYQTLARRKPELNNGIYAYAQALAGNFVGFNIAWGYWISAWIGNASYLIIIFSALSYFFPLFGAGNTGAAILGASLLLWAIHWMILRGIRAAAQLSAVTTAIRLMLFLLFIGLAVFAFNTHLFTQNFWGQPALGSFYSQINSTLLITVWVFIGIEGASVLSSHARSRADIGRATLIGFAIVLFIMTAVSLLSFGILPQEQLANLQNPSMAGVLGHIAGQWSIVLINLGLLIAVGGTLLAWILLAAETLFIPACHGVMPRFLAVKNHRGVPANALWLTNGLTQILLLITLFSNSTYLALITLAASMILMPYLFSAIYAATIAIRGQAYATADKARWRDACIGCMATLYCCWLLYGAGLKYLLFSALLYVPNIILYVWAQYEKRAQSLLKPFELIIMIAQCILAAIAIWALATGLLSL